MWDLRLQTAGIAIGASQLGWMPFIKNLVLEIMEVVNMCCTNIPCDGLKNIPYDDLKMNGSAMPKF